MPKQTINTLKNYFKKGLKPLEAHFANLIDSFFHKDDTIAISNITGLQNALNDLASIESLEAAVTSIRGGVPVGGDTLKKLHDFILVLQAATHTHANKLVLDTYTRNETQLNTYITNAIAAVVDSAPGTLDTLNELAAALGDDPNLAATLTTLIGTKASKTTGETEMDYSPADSDNADGFFKTLLTAGKLKLKPAFDRIVSRIGLVDNLVTTSKTNLVTAINEVAGLGVAPIEITYAAMVGLKNGSGLKPGKMYLITDSFTRSHVNNNGPVLVLATSANTFATDALYKAEMPDYTDILETPGFLGVFNPATFSFDAGEICIYDGFTWEANTAGNESNVPGVDAGWDQIANPVTKWEKIRYDFNTDAITHRVNAEGLQATLLSDYDMLVLLPWGAAGIHANNFVMTKVNLLNKRGGPDITQNDCQDCEIGTSTLNKPDFAFYKNRMISSYINDNGGVLYTCDFIGVDVYGNLCDIRAVVAINSSIGANTGVGKEIKNSPRILNSNVTNNTNNISNLDMYNGTIDANSCVINGLIGENSTLSNNLGVGTLAGFKMSGSEVVGNDVQGLSGSNTMLQSYLTNAINLQLLNSELTNFTIDAWDFAGFVVSQCKFERGNMSAITLSGALVGCKIDLGGVTLSGITIPATSGKTKEIGFSNFEVTKDVTGLSNVTIAEAALMGIIHLASTNASETLNKITIPDAGALTHDLTFFAEAGKTITFAKTNYAAVNAHFQLLMSADHTIDGDKKESISFEVVEITNGNGTFNVFRRKNDPANYA